MNYNKIIRKLKRNSKALSPVVASIILIAVTVAVSVVVAAWMGGMTIGLMGSAEQVSITNVAFVPGTTDTINVLIQNSGGNVVTVSSAFLNGVAIDSSGMSVVNPSPAPSPAFSIAKSSSITVSLTIPNTINSGKLSPGTAYTVKLITEKGTSAVYTATYSP